MKSLQSTNKHFSEIEAVGNLQLIIEAPHGEPNKLLSSSNRTPGKVMIEKRRGRADRIKSGTLPVSKNRQGMPNENLKNSQVLLKRQTAEIGVSLSLLRVRNSANNPAAVGINEQDMTIVGTQVRATSQISNSALFDDLKVDKAISTAIQRSYNRKLIASPSYFVQFASSCTDREVRVKTTA